MSIEAFTALLLAEGIGWLPPSRNSLLWYTSRPRSDSWSQFLTNVYSSHLRGVQGSAQCLPEGAGHVLCVASDLVPQTFTCSNTVKVAINCTISVVTLEGGEYGHSSGHVTMKQENSCTTTSTTV